MTLGFSTHFPDGTPTLFPQIKNHPEITDVQHRNDVIQYKKAGKIYRIEHVTNHEKRRIELHLFGDPGLLYITDTAEDMCDFILV